MNSLKSDLLPSYWQCGPLRLSLKKPLIMGIVNATPDSFYAGSRAPDNRAAIDYAKALMDEGADILDIGGESTRPGAGSVDGETETARVVPVIEALSKSAIPISVDTSKALVAQRALEAGAVIVNDVWSLKADADMADLMGKSQCGLVLMHARGRSANMGSLATYQNLMDEVVDETKALLDNALAAGVSQGRIMLDPGVGFAKLAEQNLLLLRESHRLLELGCPLLVGASRKSFLSQCFSHGMDQRLEGSLAAVASAILAGARVIRVHDVASTRRFVDVFWGIQRAE